MMFYFLSILLAAALGAGFMFAYMRHLIALQVVDARTVSGLSELDFELAMTRARWNRKRMEKW